MKKLLFTFIVSVISIATLAEGEPQVSILPWTNSLDIIDFENNPVTLDYARIIDKDVNGSVPAYSHTYDNYRMELIAHFDRAIAANKVTMYGQICSEGYDSVWTVIEGITKEKTHKVWKPIKIPALAKDQEITLIRTMLGSNFNIYYNKTNILWEPYGLSFLTWIQKFYCSIVYHDKQYLGTVCTIDCVLINTSTNERIKINSFEYRYDKDKYKEDDPGQWYNCRIGWYDKLPRDYNRCVNCSVTDVDGESLGLRNFGELEFDGDANINITTNKFANKSAYYSKKLVAVVKGGKRSLFSIIQ